jgi:hypothetical protein
MANKRTGLPDQVCPFCGNSFTPVNEQQVYCSSKHRHDAYMIRKLIGTILPKGDISPRRESHMKKIRPAPSPALDPLPTPGVE